MEQVLQKIQAKLIFRHPHVFSDWQVKDKQTVLENWEKLKAIEREGKNHETSAGIFEGGEMALPALAQAEIIQKRAARVGFDWKDLSGVTAKLVEEMAEVQQAEDPASQAGEIGDLLFSVVNLARWLGVDAESALREANARFRERFAAIESEARRQARDLGSLSLEEMDQIWEASKHKKQ
jgi:MazG family protein